MASSRWSKFRFGARPEWSNSSVPAHLQIDPEKFADLKARVSKRLWQESGVDYYSLQKQINSCKANPPISCADVASNNLAFSPSGLQLAKLIAYRDSLNKVETCLSYREKMEQAFDKEYDPTDRVQELARRNHQFSKNLLQQMADECTSLIAPLETKLTAPAQTVQLPQIPPPLSSLRQPTQLAQNVQLPQLPPPLSSPRQTLPRLSTLPQTLPQNLFSLPSSFSTAETFLQNLGTNSTFPIQQTRPASTPQKVSRFGDLFSSAPLSFQFSPSNGEEDDDNEKKMESKTTDDDHSQFSTPAFTPVPWLQNNSGVSRFPLFSPHLDQLYQLNPSNLPR